MVQHIRYPNIAIMGGIVEADPEKANQSREQFEALSTEIVNTLRGLERSNLLAQVAMLTLIDQQKFGTKKFSPSLEIHELEFIIGLSLNVSAGSNERIATGSQVERIIECAGETDFVMSVDRSIAIFEAKSASITQPARRGAEGRLKRTIEEILVEPSRQSGRLEKLIKASPDPIILANREQEIEIGGTDLRQVIRLNVTFDTLGPLSACSARLKECGFLRESEDIAPTMSIFELETVLKILPDQVSRIHYLRRRSEIEKSAYFDADELDLLSMYLDNAFCLPELENDQRGFSIYGWSERIAYEFSERKPREQRKLTVKRSPLWRKLIKVLENRRDPGWTRFGYHLSNIPFHAQFKATKIKQEVQKLARKRGAGKSAYSGIHASSSSDDPALVICAGHRVSDMGVYACATEGSQTVLRDLTTNEALVVYWDSDLKDGAYRFIATMLRQQQI